MKKGEVLIALGALSIFGLGACGQKELKLVAEQVEVELGSKLDRTVTNYVELDAKEADETTIDFSAVDTTKIGTYPALITYKKQNIAFEVVVRDTTAPKVEVVDVVMVAAEMPLYAEDVISSITEFSGETTAAFTEDKTEPEAVVGDNVEEFFTIGNVRCGNAYIIYPEVGEFDNILTVTDASGNATEIDVHIIVGEAPTFSGVDDITVTVGADEVDYLKDVNAKDYIGNDLTDRIVCDSSAVKLDKAGEYEIVYTVKDENGFTAIKTVTVTVKEKTVSKTSTSIGNESSAVENAGSGNGGSVSGNNSNVGSTSGGNSNNGSAENVENAGNSSGSIDSAPGENGVGENISGDSGASGSTGDTATDTSAEFSGTSQEEWENMGFETYNPEPGMGADDGTGLGGSWEWYD